MAQVTLYLDEETARLAKAAARAAGVSQSRWLANLIRETTSTQWPSEFREAAGSWPDFPDVEELRDYPDDAEREPL